MNINEVDTYKALQQTLAQAKCSVCLLLLLLFLFYSRSDLISQHEEQTKKHITQFLFLAYHL